MNSVITRLTSRIASFNDLSKLCFAAATVFAIVGAGGWLANYLSPGTSHLSVFLLISSFYLSLGLIEQLRKNRSAIEKPGETIKASGHQHDQVTNRRSDRAA